MKRIIYIFILLVFLSCDKERRPVRGGGQIEFSVTTPDMVTTKAEFTAKDLVGTGLNVFVYGTQSDGISSVTVVDAPGAQLIYDDDKKVWYPQVYDDASFKMTNLEWEDGLYYRFYGFAFSSDARLGDNLKIVNNTYGRQFAVTQPNGGNGETTIDYLLSSLVSVAPVTNRPLVPVDLEHAMARVDVDVLIAQSMFDDQGCRASNISVSISGIKTKATMLCLQPKQYGELGSNTWYVSFDENQTYATYTTSPYVNNTEANLEGGDDGINPDMTFMAVPVANEEMSDYTLTLSYDGRSGAHYSYSFDLQQFSPKGWVNGHKIKYVLTIDNSINLKGTIMDYEDVEYLEAVIVPGFDQGAGDEN